MHVTLTPGISTKAHTLMFIAQEDMNVIIGRIAETGAIATGYWKNALDEAQSAVKPVTIDDHTTYSAIYQAIARLNTAARTVQLASLRAPDAMPAGDLAQVNRRLTESMGAVDELNRVLEKSTS